MSFVRLLEQWSEIEPDRCTYTSGIFTIRGWSISYDTDVSERLTLAEIQCSVQEAIEHRGWNWYVGRVLIDGNTYFKAGISIPNTAEEISQRLNSFLSSDSAARALLNAYLIALETIEKPVLAEA